MLNDENPFQAHVSNNENVECARMLDNFMMAIEKVCIYIHSHTHPTTTATMATKLK